MNGRGFKVVAIRDETPYLFDMSQPGASEQELERPFVTPDVFLGTSSFTANGWQGTFYPPGIKSAERLKYYSTQFQTVEIDSTFYGTPSAATVKGWYERTPPDFIFAAKVPQICGGVSYVVQGCGRPLSLGFGGDIAPHKLG